MQRTCVLDLLLVRAAELQIVLFNTISQHLGITHFVQVFCAITNCFYGQIDANNYKA